jgi:hypothetical protein
MGLISRAVTYLFQRIEEDAEGSTTVMKAAFSEIYNEVRPPFACSTAHRAPSHEIPP